MPRAPKHCGYHSCTVLVHPPAKRCPEHNSGWKTSPPTASSKVTGTRRWKERIRPSILNRDGYQCQIRYDGICTGTAEVVDKIIAAAIRPDLAWEPTNLRAACQSCNDHKARTEDQGRPA